MTEALGLNYLILEEALEEIAGQEPENVGFVFAKCRYCSASAPIKAKNSIKHTIDCPAHIAFKALIKVRNSFLSGENVTK